MWVRMLLTPPLKPIIVLLKNIVTVILLLIAILMVAYINGEKLRSTTQQSPELKAFARQAGIYQQMQNYIH